MTSMVILSWTGSVTASVYSTSALNSWYETGLELVTSRWHNSRRAPVQYNAVWCQLYTNLNAVARWHAPGTALHELGTLSGTYLSWAVFFIWGLTESVRAKTSDILIYKPSRGVIIALLEMNSQVARSLISGEAGSSTHSLVTNALSYF